MNIAYYGHARNLVYSYNLSRIYHEFTWSGGMKLIHKSIISALEDEHGRGGHHTMHSDNNDEFHRDYYELSQYETNDNYKYFSASRHLGYREGTTPNNIYSIPPENTDKPADLLVVWDEGCCGLSLPDNSRCVFWASNKSMPDKEQFKKVASKCFLMLDANILRSAGAMISRQISWERTASELIQQIQSNPAINYLLDAQILFVLFEFDGAVIISPRSQSGQLEAAISLTHGGIEGAISQRRQGESVLAFDIAASLFIQQIPLILSGKGIFGDTIKRRLPNNLDDIPLENLWLLICNYLTELLHGQDVNDDINAVVGIGTMLRHVLEAGEASILTGFQLDEEKDTLDIQFNVEEKQWAAFPIPLKANEEGVLHIPTDWTITNNVGNKRIYDVAFEYVLEGSKIIDGLPQLKMGALTTIDRWEIESYQNIRNLILNYASSPTSNPVRPLSIAVFGSPGSGKSFGVTQIAKNILPGIVEKLEFNVSQFLSVTDLGAAFQKVRDVILEGKLPLVFFDEFDSDKDGAALGWIKSFLMPMQDGRFRDESGEHPLGKCILVFAGGTASSFEEFVRPKPKSVEGSDQDVRKYAEKAMHDFANVKGPDFVSRLQGTINVLGPNPKDKNDKNHVLRRALLIRSLCERKLDINIGKTQISPAIIHAMLLVPEFKHGARSMEAIFNMSRIEGGVWEPASLPFHSQLELHVDADAYIKLVQYILAEEHLYTASK
ncbi:MAG: hypothetical protein FWC77_06355 [Defluviitaleaceae bacterium]|nr:hypothetical protein [Defluviitaleaceae bacterium]